MSSHDKKTFANEYCLCRQIPHQWAGGMTEQLIVGTAQTGKGCIYSIYNIPYSEIVNTIDKMCEYDEFGRFVTVKRLGWG